jgi:hypothetical protein
MRALMESADQVTGKAPRPMIERSNRSAAVALERIPQHSPKWTIDIMVFRETAQCFSDAITRFAEVPANVVIGAGEAPLFLLDAILVTESSVFLFDSIGDRAERIPELAEGVVMEVASAEAIEPIHDLAVFLTPLSRAHCAHLRLVNPIVPALSAQYAGEWIARPGRVRQRDRRVGPMLMSSDVPLEPDPV